MNQDIRNALALLAPVPGVYLMHAEDDEIIYVGKAKSLKARVSQYFLRPQKGKVAVMVSRVRRIETIETLNEKEAFILEMNLIKKHHPTYNVVLKDGKHYPYIALRKAGDPVLRIMHQAKDHHYDYFGPFPSAQQAREVLHLLERIFPTRKCLHKPKAPCLYHHLGQCLAPCVKAVDEKTMTELRRSIKAFLEGHDEAISRRLREEMKKAAGELNFERAEELKKTLEAIEHIQLSQGVEERKMIARDVFAYVLKEDHLALSVLTYRRGLLLGREAFVVTCFEDAEEEVVDLILQYYDAHPLPKEILLNVDDAAKRLRSLLDVRIITGQRGHLLQLIDLAQLDAKKELSAFFLKAQKKDDDRLLLKRLGELLKIKTPERIDLFDISHLQGDAAVGVAVVFRNAMPDKRLYRRYDIKGQEKRDDPASLYEVLRRRYQRLKDENGLMPDLLLLDGGLYQVQAGHRALAELELSIPIFGLFKNERHRTAGLIDGDGKTYDLGDDQQLFFLLVRMQDEVHRYALFSHHTKRRKLLYASPLDGVPGLGPKRRERLLNLYQSMEQLSAASVTELAQILPLSIAMKVHEVLRSH